MNIGTIGNCKGRLEVYPKNEKFFWRITDTSSFGINNEQEIPKELYDVMVKFQNQKSYEEYYNCPTCNGTGKVETNRFGYDSIMGKCPDCKK